MATARADYIGFYNTVWLVLNDLIVGQALGRLLLANDRLLADWLQCGIKVRDLSARPSGIEAAR